MYSILTTEEHVRLSAYLTSISCLLNTDAVVAKNVFVADVNGLLSDVPIKLFTFVKSLA